MTQKQEVNGRLAEKLICVLLRNNGFWCHSTNRSASGSQPVDIIAVRGRKKEEGHKPSEARLSTVVLCDAKHVRKEDASFVLSRCEANQITSLRYARDFAGLDDRLLGWAILFARDRKSIRFLSLKDYERHSANGVKSLNIDELPEMQEALGI